MGSGSSLPFGYLVSAGRLALLAGLAQLSGATVDEGPLSEASLATRARLDDLVARNPEHVTMLEKLEVAYDDLHDVRGQLPDGDQLAAELERGLRSHAVG